MTELTKNDRAALWHALSLAEAMVKECECSSDIPPETKAYERQRYNEARKALRKLYAAAHQQQEGCSTPP